jgi:serine/threonine-protein kinase
VTAALRHPGIVAIFDLDEKHRRIVMELLGGGTLRERLLSGPLPVAEAVRRHAEVLGALVAAHRHGVVHRDLKPGNLLYRRDPARPTEIVLCDFGSAALGPVAAETAAVGTMRYMAPEQRRGFASPASDLFAAGVILYESLAGKPPLALAEQAPSSGLALPDGIAPEPVVLHLMALTRADPALRPSGPDALASARGLDVAGRSR